MTSTPTQSIDSQEGEDSTLPQDHGEDNLSQSWGDITEEPRAWPHFYIGLEPPQTGKQSGKRGEHL